MLLAAAFVPDTAVLVPGAAGRADPLATLRAAALDAVTQALQAGRRAGAAVLVVAPGRADRTVSGQIGESLAALGIPDSLRPGRAGWHGAEPHGVSTAVAAHLLDTSGHAGAVCALELGQGPARPGRAAELRRRGAGLAEDDLVLLVVGSGTARNGPEAPLAPDEAAAQFDERLRRCLVGADVAGIGDLSEASADRLGATCWAPWQIAAGALGPAAAESTVLAEDRSLGVWHPVALWRTR